MSVLGIGARGGVTASGAGTDIAERAELLEQLGRDRGALRRSASLGAQPRLERRAQRVGARRLPGGEVHPLGRVTLEVVELGARGQNVFPPSVADRAEVAPSVVKQRRQRFGIAAASCGGGPPASEAAMLRPDHYRASARASAGPTAPAASAEHPPRGPSARHELPARCEGRERSAARGAWTRTRSSHGCSRHDRRGPSPWSDVTIDEGVRSGASGFERAEQPSDELVGPRDLTVIRPAGERDR